MKLKWKALYLGLAAWLCGATTGYGEMAIADKMTILPAPKTMGSGSLARLLEQRRSVRSYRPGPLTLAEAGQLLWAAQGVTDPRGLRTAPSAGALYPLELYLVAGAVDGLAAGVYRYDPQRHRVEQWLAGDRRDALSRAALGQEWVARASVVMVLAAEYRRTTGKYGERGIRYVHMETGHAAQNLFLQAEALGLGAVVVGAFDDDRAADVLELPRSIRPLLLMPIGRK